MERGELIAGRYELEKRLGRGGMGEVWAGRDRMLHRDVAVKMLVLDEGVHTDLPRRFEREAVAAAQISHPNVVALHDRGVHEDLWFLVMERVEGANLAEHIRDESSMDVARALQIAQEICAALVAAHQAQVIHYDIKPHNVMLTPDGRVKVVDFGIAGFIQRAFTLAHSSQLAPAGTPEYGAPEQFLTEHGDVRSDLYALGSVLFAMLTGRPPFTGQTGLAIMHQKLAEDAPSLGTHRPELPPAVIQLVTELLQRDPDQRPQTAAAVHEHLGRLRTALDTLGTSDATTLTRVPSRITTPPPTQRQPADDGPFEISWTGREPTTDYARMTSAHVSRVWRVSAVLWAITAGGLGYALADGAFQREESSPTPGSLAGLAGVIAGIFALVYLLVLVLSVVRRRYERERPPWSLSVGPHGIVATGAFRRAVGWDQIQMVTVEAIPSHMPYDYRALYVRSTDAANLASARPAGWAYPSGIYRRPDRRIPLCVLGPMTEQQHSEFTDALIRYAGALWHPEAGH
ncbi:serine/threonine protein kinase [Streptomyces sp. NBC_00250]|uniref:serine/threonine-protein kinase n=1 Tax=Streptomyces sp. NBC_00250 TaxID=2903641 RepID=UPI002E2815B9|nr:serine/threonine-protein kinase [Streptomyces sp. NBC_00250]